MHVDNKISVIYCLIIVVSLLSIRRAFELKTDRGIVFTTEFVQCNGYCDVFLLAC